MKSNVGLLAALLVVVVGDVVLGLVAGPTAVLAIPAGIAALARLVVAWHGGCPGRRRREH
jgi:hypothetical protein